MPRNSRIQFSKIAIFWAVITFALSLAWSVVLNLLGLTGIGSAATLTVPGVLGAVLAVLLYYTRVHETLDYDDYRYSVVRGRSGKQEHKWSEFKESSVIRDSYGRHKVRVYRERDGEHYDIDTKACGINPFSFRDFASTRIRGGVKEPSVSSPEIFAGLEREIQRGRAYWIADLNETFKPFQTAGETFSLMARGSTRPKGFLLSRFVAVTLMPNYEVALYANELGGSEEKSRMMRFVRIIETMRDQKNIKWSWLLLFGDEDPSLTVVRTIEDFGNKDIGIGYIATRTGRLITSPNQLGRSMVQQMRLSHLMRDIKRRTLRTTEL